MKKLLLSLASLALISTSLYAGCTADVDMDGNRIMKLGAPTAGTDAVNRDYVDGREEISSDVVLTSGWSLHGGSLKITKLFDNICVFSAVIKKDVATSGWETFVAIGGIPSGFRPKYHPTYTIPVHNTTEQGFFDLQSNGLMMVKDLNGAPADTTYSTQAVYICG
jgi:hypothetical protein